MEVSAHDPEQEAPRPSFTSFVSSPWRSGTSCRFRALCGSFQIHKATVDGERPPAHRIATRAIRRKESRVAEIKAKPSKRC